MKNKINRYLFLSIFLLIPFLTINIFGAYLEKFPVKVTQPDGQELKLFASGDEYYNWLHDIDGYTIMQDPESGYYVYAIMEKGELKPSQYIVNGNYKPAELKIPRGLKQPRNRIPNREDLYPTLGEGPLNAPKTGGLNNIVIFIRFSGESEFTDNISTYNSMFNNTTANTNSMRNYFTEASYNQLTINTTFYPEATTTVVSYQDSHVRGYFQPYSVTNTIGYSNDSERTTREHTLLKNAVDAVSADIPTDLNVDGDGDGYVDNVCFIVSGSPTAWATLLWPHMWSLYSQVAYINSKRVYTFNFQLRDSLMSSGVGVLCHEMFHSLGSPDLYHYSYDGLNPVWAWELMASDSNPPRHISAYMKYKYGGWISSIPTITTSGTYSLNPLSSSTNNCYKIASPNSATEYFVIEYRKKTTIFENSLPGEGLLVYRINTSYTGNASGPPDEVYIYRPNGTLTDDGSPNSANFNSSVGRTAINDITNPSSFLSTDKPGGLNISGIGAVGSTISFNVSIAPAGTNILVIQSSPSSGIPITISPNDANGNGSGTTDLFRYYNGTTVTLTAPETYGSYSFNSWSVDGVTNSNRTIQVVMSSPHRLIANYPISINEAVDNSTLTFTSAGTQPWMGQTTTYYYGGDAAQSGAIGDAETSSFQTTVTGPGDLSFYWKVSSESGFDFLNFYVDNVSQYDITGSVDWQQKSLSIASGTHTLRWTYSKDGTLSGGSDKGWVDKIVYTIPRSVTVTSPNGGESWKLGSSQNITWTSSGLTETLTISLWQNGVKVGDIASDISNSTNSYSWTVGNYSGGTVSAGTGYTIKIIEAASGVNDSSNASFTIIDPIITVTSPNGGEVWKMGSTQTITWTSSGLTSQLKVILLKNGVRVGDIATGLAKTATSYSWTVGNYIGGTAADSNDFQIKVEETLTATSDTSDAVFTIYPVSSITVMSPNGGEELIAGHIKNISWTHTYLRGSQKVTLWQNDSYIGTIADNIPLTKRYVTWNPIGSYIGGTAPSGSGYKIKVEENGSTTYDISDASFTISGATPSPQITLSSPNGGESYLPGKMRPITWTVTGSISNVKIDYSTDNGNNWISIIASTPNTGKYSWYIPSVESSLCLVRISKSDNASIYDISNNAFQITSTKSISLTSPNGGETWTRGTTYNITWNASGIARSYKITLWKNDVLVDTIANAIPSTARSYSWRAGDLLNARLFVPGTGFKIKIEVEEPGTTTFDSSDTTFTIN